MEIKQLARYPFVKSASELIRQESISLEDLLGHQAFSAARHRGKQRIIDSVEKAQVQDAKLTSREDMLQEILSYAMARILVSSVGDGFLIRRYALAEAKTAYEHLQIEPIDLVMEIAAELGVDATLDRGVPSMHFGDFLRYTSGIRSKEWKLVNTEVKKGLVSLPKIKFARVLEQALHDKIEDELPLPVADWMIKALKDDIQELKGLAEQMKDRYKVEGFGEIDAESFPPCIRRLIAMARSGENISHPGRFALTSFLFSIGLSRDEILAIFASSPDFDESKTRYQIDHITGEISGTKYTPPECSTMKSFGNCHNVDDLCRQDWVKHPLIYYRAKSRRRRKQPGAKTVPQPAAPAAGVKADAKSAPT
ncbi:MAG: DNA primase large subunit PriL [Methanomassiliicoccales archaeon]|nr:DNA primase large subunit PriL [Methanomassiliicoccales archaeon]